jgi:hypothetical protein
MKRDTCVRSVLTSGSVRSRTRVEGATLAARQSASARERPMP